jgi:hypothetical protein
LLSIIIRAIVGIIFAVLGLIGVFSPSTSRTFIGNFLAKAPVRGLGLFLMLLGAGVFRVASHLYFPLLGKMVGVVLFMVGGIHIFIPEFAIVLNEWWVARKLTWERLVSVAYVAFAVLCFMPQEGISWPSRPPQPEVQEEQAAPGELPADGPRAEPDAENTTPVVETPPESPESATVPPEDG